MAKDLTMYVVIGIMIIIIGVAAIAAKFSPPAQEQVISEKNETMTDKNPQVSMFFKNEVKEVVAVEEALPTSAKIKVGEESEWVDVDQVHKFKSRVLVKVTQIKEIKEGKFEVELWVAK